MSRKLKRDQKTQEKTREAGRVSGKYKTFSKETYDRTAPAVDSLIQWYDKQDLYLEHNINDPYGPDAIEWFGFRPVRYLEVAQRSAWKEGKWPSKWDPLNIEERKVHLFKLSLPCDYWVVSSDYKNALKISHETVVKYINNLEEVSNATFREGEKFLRIPLEECELIDLTN
jgi:hypothetical protein